jgi:hypothetical protein
MQPRLNTCQYDRKQLKIVLFFFSFKEKKKYCIRDNSSSKEADSLNFILWLTSFPCMKTISKNIEKTVLHAKRTKESYVHVEGKQNKMVIYLLS